MKPKLTWWSWEKMWNNAKIEILFYDIRPKYFSFWKQNLVLLSSGHLTFNFLNFFPLICSLQLGNKTLALPMFQMLWEPWMASSFCCFYCTMGPTEGLYCSSNTVWVLWTKIPSPGFVSESGVFLKCLAVLYTPSRALGCLWWGWPLWRGLVPGITMSKSGLGIHSEIHTKKYHTMH